MSHTIFVPGDAPPAATLSAVPGLIWCSADGPGALDAGFEVVVTCDGAARGVALVRKAEGTAVRLFTASSRADVDLAIAAVLALAAAGEGGALNEDDEELDDADEIADRYDDEFRTAYVAWGPSAMAAQLDDEAGSLALSGPWTNAQISGAELAALRRAHADDEAFADAVLAHLVAAQRAARPLHARLDAGDVVEGRGVIEAWISHQNGPDSAARIWRVLGALPDDALASPMMIDVALSVSAAVSPTGTDPLAARIRDAVVRLAADDPDYAAQLAERAHELAQGGDFPLALVLFDVVVALPDLGTAAIDVSSGAGVEHVGAQATWMCNATWAAQADNNKLPVDAARARRYIDRATPYAANNPPLFFNLACLAFEIGDHAAALRFISLAKQHGFQRMQTIADEPLLAPLRADPRWRDALAGTLA